MSIYSSILDLATAEEGINLKRAQGEEAAARAQAIQESITTAKATRDALQAAARAQEQAPDPGSDAPKPPEDSEGLENNAEIRSVNDVMRAAATDYKAQEALFKVFRSVGNAAEMNKAADNMRLSQERIQAGQLRKQEIQKQKVERMGGIAASATPENFEQVRDQLDRMAPGWDRKANVDFSLADGGRVVWGPNTKLAMEQIAQQSATATQQIDAKVKVQNAATAAKNSVLAEKEHQRKEVKDAQDVVRDRERLAQGDRRLTQSREQFEANMPLREAAAEGMRERNEDMRVRQVQAEYDKAPEVVTFNKFDKARNLAGQIRRKLDTDPRSVTDAEMSELLTTFQDAARGFRSRSGDAGMNMKTKAQLEGLMQKSAAFAGRLGKGNLGTTPDTVRDLTDGIYGLYLDSAEVVAKQGLAARQKAVQRGLDPERVVVKDTIDTLVNNKRAQKFTDSNGAEWVKLGPADAPPVEGSNVFKIPKAVAKSTKGSEKKYRFNFTNKTMDEIETEIERIKQLATEEE